MNKLNLFHYFKRYSFLYLIALIAMCASTLLDQAAPLLVQHIVDDVLIAKKMEVLNFLLLGSNLLAITSVSKDVKFELTVPLKISSNDWCC